MTLTLADELRGKPKSVVNARMFALLPVDVREEFTAAANAAENYLAYCSVVESYAERFKLGFGRYDLTSAHDEEPEWSSLVRRGA